MCVRYYCRVCVNKLRFSSYDKGKQLKRAVYHFHIKNKYMPVYCKMAQKDKYSSQVHVIKSWS